MRRGSSRAVARCGLPLPRIRTRVVKTLIQGALDYQATAGHPVLNVGRAESQTISRSRSATESVNTMLVDICQRNLISAPTPRLVDSQCSCSSSDCKAKD